MCHAPDIEERQALERKNPSLCERWDKEERQASSFVSFSLVVRLPHVCMTKNKKKNNKRL